MENYKRLRDVVRNAEDLLSSGLFWAVVYLAWAVATLALLVAVNRLLLALAGG